MAPPLFPRSPCLQQQDAATLRSEILTYFHATFDRYESLFRHLTGDAAYLNKS